MKNSPFQTAARLLKEGKLRVGRKRVTTLYYPAARDFLDEVRVSTTSGDLYVGRVQGQRVIPRKIPGGRPR